MMARLSRCRLKTADSSRRDHYIFGVFLRDSCWFAFVPFLLTHFAGTTCGQIPSAVVCRTRTCLSTRYVYETAIFDVRVVVAGRVSAWFVARTGGESHDRAVRGIPRSQRNNLRWNAGRHALPTGFLLCRRL